MFCCLPHSRVSFDNIEKKWHPEISHHWQNTKVPVPCILVGLKADVRNDAEAMKELTRRNCEPVSFEEVSIRKEFYDRVRRWLNAFKRIRIWSVVQKLKMD